MKEGFYYRDMNAAYYGIYWFGFDIRGVEYKMSLYALCILIFYIYFYFKNR